MSEKWVRPFLLLVDDEDCVLTRYGAALEEAGFRVVAASNCELAVTAARTQSPDVVLMDMMMPVKDGFDTLKELKALENYQPRLTGLMMGAPPETDGVRALSGRNECFVHDAYDFYVIKPWVKGDELGPYVLRLLTQEPSVE